MRDGRGITLCQNHRVVLDVYPPTQEPAHLGMPMDVTYTVLCAGVPVNFTYMRGYCIWVYEVARYVPETKSVPDGLSTDTRTGTGLDNCGYCIYGLLCRCAGKFQLRGYGIDPPDDPWDGPVRI